MAEILTSEKFEELYKKLNPEQKRAVDTVEGPVMVVAGPGTGKTQILTLRIANILKETDTDPNSILSLTFTESGVFAMRKRLAEIIGSAAYRVNIHTFHGFCNEIIKKYPEEFPRIIGAESISEVDQIKIVEEVIMNAELNKLRPYGDPLYYVRSALSQIKNLKRDDIDPDAFEVLLKKQQEDFKSIPDLYHEKGAYKGKMKGVYQDIEKNIEKNKELLIIYRAYEKVLQEKRIYDYEDMIMEVVRVLRKNNDLLLRLQEQYQYILADEHQDANFSQNHILELLTNFHKNPNLFIVGDEKQAIYRFQGASLENFLYFQKLHPQAVRINLVSNYRSTQHILDTAHSLIIKNAVDQSLHTRLESGITKKDSKDGDVKNVKVYEFPEAQSEYLFLLEDIKKRIAAGVAAQEIAILFRDNKDVEPLARMFEKTDIPFVIESGQDVLSDSDIGNLALLLRVINEFGNEALLARAFFIDFLTLNNLDVYKLLSFSTKEKISLYDVLSSPDLLTKAQVSNTDTFLNIYTKLSAWSSLAKNRPLIEVFETITRESGFLDHILKIPGSLEKLAKLNTFFDEVKRLTETNREYHLSDFITHLDLLATHKILIKVEHSGSEYKGVRLMTAHRSKGLEFDFVYIIGAYDGHWGNKRMIRTFQLPNQKEEMIDENADERRLFYVAITRARKAVTISFARENAGKQNALPSQFLEELDPALVEKVSVPPLTQEEAKIHQTFSFEPQKNFGMSLTDKQFLQNLFLEQGLSVTSINKFLKCPWDYFFENLLRLPRAQTKHQLYGTAVHEAFKLFFDRIKEEQNGTKNDLIRYFKLFLEKKPLSQHDFTESLEKGNEALSGYYDAYHTIWSKDVLTEFRIGGIEVPIETGGGEKFNLTLKGVLDKLEFISPEKVRVIDYKTRKPLSRNEIEGKTKNGTGDYKRQLVFYKFLLDNYENKKYSFLSGTIDFIEPDMKGNYKKEEFEISDAEVRELEETIRKIAVSIYTFSFWDEECDDEKCEYCDLRKSFNRSRENQ